MIDYSGIKRIAEHYGLEHQIGKLREELAELYDVAFDISLDPAAFRSHLTALVDEMADVKVMVAQIEILTDTVQETADRMEYKIKRQLDRIRRGVERD